MNEKVTSIDRSFMLLIFYGCSGSCNVRSILKRQWEEFFPNEILFLYDRFWPARPRMVHSAHTQSETLRVILCLLERIEATPHWLLLVPSARLYPIISLLRTLHLWTRRRQGIILFGMSGDEHVLRANGFRTYWFWSWAGPTHSILRTGRSFHTLWCLIIYHGSNCHFDDFCQVHLTWLIQWIGSSVLISNDRRLIWGFHIMSKSKWPFQEPGNDSGSLYI